MLPSDDDWIGQVAVESVWRAGIDTDAARCIADDVVRGVSKGNVRVEVRGVWLTGLSLGEMEGALTCDVGRICNKGVGNSRSHYAQRKDGKSKVPHDFFEEKNKSRSLRTQD